MKGLLSYGALTTKVRAMRGKLLKEEDYRTMASFETVPEVADYLSALSPYSGLFSSLDSGDLHRGRIERLLNETLRRDYAKLYRFASMKQRQFFKLYFMHFETDLLKNCLRAIAARQPMPPVDEESEAFFRKHSPLDLSRVTTASTLDELIDSLEGTMFYPILNSLREAGDAGHFDYEMALDLFYFRTTWKAIQKKLARPDRELALQNFGTKLDLLNLQWIYRTKRYYNSSAETIKNLLIPIHCRLHEPQFERLLAAESREEFFNALSETWYGPRLRAADMEEKPDLELLYYMILNQIHRAASRNHPYSMASLYAYLYFKEEEVRRIVTVIEGVRYRIGTAEIMNLIEHT